MRGADVLPGTILIGDLQFEVRESSRRATVGITVDRDGSLQLLAPMGCSPDALAAWAYSKRMWVYRKIAEKDLLLSARPAKEFVNGEGFSYLGRNHRLLIADVETVRMDRGRLLMPRRDVDAGQPDTALIRWYRHCGRQWLPSRLRPWADRMNVTPEGVEVRDLGYRWGSLGVNSQLNIHWAALQLPPTLIDYVLVHELAHLHHAQHGLAFWTMVERAMPEYERRKSDLSLAGAALWLG